MAMRLLILLRPELALYGGFGRTVFPRVEEQLSNSSYYEAFARVAKRKQMDKYRSKMDFLLCEALPVHRAACFRFYEDQGPQLVDLHSAHDLLVIEASLLAFLEVAYYSALVESSISWKKAMLTTEYLVLRLGL